ncbi:MAG TPA: TetR family transcriptional regulator C-terminal domain-containing protein [Acidocella sp.]|uniref:TetR/AcrR family transcriptional regulator n=1 Tax=Acidocella sp. TaxID=50710 RepID=UPI002C456D56|nr:TetR family transcriptional regulator C-terminal domain-containing protein [Acidocella sp.]HVE22637.1 TetR family transcriptional regulator C-terminal domain-containing protein [Acidocella sp.]
MAKPSNRTKILTEGLRIVHERGFGGASVRDIAQAAQVPLGSFTNHFASKEAFGLEILELYYRNSRVHIAETLSNPALQPLDRIRAYVDHIIAVQNGTDMRRGCLFGNFGAEVVEQFETMRLRLVEMFEDIRHAFADCLKAAVAAGELPEDYRCEDAACFLFAALQGAIVVAKTQRSDVPLTRYKRMIFETVLH